MRNFKKVISLVMITMMALLMFTGCGSKTVTMKDMEGTEFTVPKKIERIVSTAPSNTEILVGLGLGDKIVGVDKYSADVKGLNPDIPKIDFRNPDAEAILALKPDVIIASGHNREGKEDPFKVLKDAGIPVVYIPTSESMDGI
ncbi:MAG: helical backbone metal receptor, partial [Clostridium perfringens]|nr:helical backbone metal receptor [Clostridium perfringens]